MANNPEQYDRSHERFTWRGVMRFLDNNPKKRKYFKILSHPRDREMDEVEEIEGTCVYFSASTALRAANRARGVEVDMLSWEELCDMVDKNNPSREIASLEALRRCGIRTEDDYEKGNKNAKRYKVDQYYEFCNEELITDEIPCGLDQNMIKDAIDNFLSKTVMIATFPISHNYYHLEDGVNYIYQYDSDDAVTVLLEDGSTRICTHTVVVTGFGFEENIPYFEFLDSCGDTFGKNGFGRILPTSILRMYGLDVVVD